MLRRMRLPALLLIPVLACGLAATGCRTRQEPPPTPQPAPVKPATGWTSELTTATAASLVEALTSDGWVTRFRENNSRMPVVEVLAFDDRSADHIPTEDLAAEFVRVLGASDRVLSATSGQVADVTLTGVLGLHGAADGSKDYTIDVRVLDKKTNDVLWVTGISKAKP
jgi:hypothetical protein